MPNTSYYDRYTLCIPHTQPAAVRKSFVINSLLKNKKLYYFLVNGGRLLLIFDIIYLEGAHLREGNSKIQGEKFQK